MRNGMIELIVTDDTDLAVAECGSCGEDIVTPYEPREYRPGIYKCLTCDAADKLAFGRQKLVDDHRRPDLPPPTCACGFGLAECRAGTCSGRPVKPDKQLGLFGGNKTLLI
jgi:hypothetical protein